MRTNYNQIARQMVLRDLSARKSGVSCFTVVCILGVLALLGMLAFAFFTL